jgi:glycogen phosphorylase
MMDDLQNLPWAAYFSMEIALESHIPTYSGGLGVLAGDLLRSAADLALPIIGVTLASRHGYVQQRISDGAQHEEPQPWDPARVGTRVQAKVPVRIGGRDVWVGAWRYALSTRCATGHAVPVLLLDTFLPENHPEDRRLTDELYGGDEAWRLKQEMVLGVGGARLLQELGVRVLKYHMNEGHAALLGLELLRWEMSPEQNGSASPEQVAAVRRRCVFTTHTPVASGHDQFGYDLVAQCLEPSIDAGLLRGLAGEERLNMTLLALNLSGWVNGVGERHAEVSRTLFPGYRVHAITNGVHPWTWASDGHRALYDQYMPHWRHEPELLVHASRIPVHAMVEAHAAAKTALLSRVTTDHPDADFRPDRLTLGFARRMTSYKRPHLLFENPERLRRIAQRYPLQLVFSGKAHPRDLEGKREIERIHAEARALAGDIPVVFLTGYDMALARLAVAGCDVWLNTPQPPLEASGTSGMKAAVNGVPSLSVLDGWWLEGCLEGTTGWAIGDDTPDSHGLHAESLYDKLEHAVAPMFYVDKERWGELMRDVVGRNGALFNSHRMLRRYMLEAYSR